jgi:hypothetical protein
VFTKKALVSLMIAVGTVGAVATPLTSIAATVRVIALDRAPPAPRDERVPAPRRGYVWSPGYWNWTSNKHAWVKGSWARERRGYAYSPNHWEESNGKWNLQHGRWERN